MTTEFGARLIASAEPEQVCDDLLTVHRWKLKAETAEDVQQLAVAVGRTYVSDQARLATPRASVASKIPPKEKPKVRSGDFGEMIAAGIYSTRMGRDVPYSKLQLSKPVAGATVQGTDTLSLTVDPFDGHEPVVVEAKTRESGQPSHVLPAVGASVGVLDEDYLVSAWAAGAQLMLAHPDHRRNFALSAAQHLGRLIDPDASLPPHARHAVAVVGRDLITRKKIEARWSDAPPVSELHVVVVDDLFAVRDSIFDTAAKLTYDDLTGGAASQLPDRTATAGITGLISRDMPERLADAAEPHPLRIVVEASLWFLADHDGIAHARASVGTDHPDQEVRGLSQLLTGALARARTSLEDSDLADFADVAADVVNLRYDPSRLHAAHAALTCEEAVKHAAGHVAAALLHRLERHPTTVTQNKGADGPAVQHVVDRMRRFGKHAFWPSQADAIRGGLLDPGQRSLAIKMPTSAGKTRLMELVIADTIDRSHDAVVAVLAPSRALVSQLSQDIRRALPDDVDVRSSQGSLDYDTALPSSAAVLAGPGVAVVTPERFDLDWRRAATEGGIDLDQIELLVVDEAQLIDQPRRGATLERVIAKALRRNIRVVLLASQFHDVHDIARWINGTPLESNWRPAWLARHVYTRSLTGGDEGRTRVGYLWPEGGTGTEALKLKPSNKTEGDGWIRKRRYETAGLVDKWKDDGLVVVFSDTKAHAVKLLPAIIDGADDTWTPAPRLIEIAESIEADHPTEAADLKRGFGLHTADVPRAVRRAIETAARTGGGLLRCIVCTSTLLEGVDFPTRTVIAAYPPRMRDHARGPDIALLRNLEGRAGRAGRFTSGRLVVMTNDYEQALKWRKAMRNELPPTQSALTSALLTLQSTAPDWMSDADRKAIDAVALEALAESGVADGHLRQALEEALQRTYWSATSAPEAQDRALDNASGYVARLAQQVPSVALRRAFHRSGLALPGLLQLRDRIDGSLPNIVQVLRDAPGDPKRHTDLLHWLTHQCVATLPELDGLRDVDGAALGLALDEWMAGSPQDQIVANHPDAWEAIQPAHLETLLLWALTGAFEIIAALDDDVHLREAAHTRLEPARLRYGVPYLEVCDLVGQGYDRVRVTEAANEYLQEKGAGILARLHLASAVKATIDAEDNESDEDDVRF